VVLAAGHACRSHECRGHDAGGHDAGGIGSKTAVSSAGRHPRSGFQCVTVLEKWQTS
jgi:hypothetical protein